MSDMSVHEAYRVLQAACGIEVGDKVRVLMKPLPNTYGWNWRGGGITEGDIGQIFEVEEFANDGTAIILPSDSKGHERKYSPFFCLKLVEKAPKATYLPPLEVSFEKDGLTIGSTFVSKDTIRRNLDL